MDNKAALDKCKLTLISFLSTATMELNTPKCTVELCTISWQEFFRISKECIEKHETHPSSCTFLHCMNVLYNTCVLINYNSTMHCKKQVCYYYYSNMHVVGPTCYNLILHVHTRRGPHAFSNYTELWADQLYQTQLHEPFWNVKYSPL